MNQNTSSSDINNQPQVSSDNAGQETNHLNLDGDFLSGFKKIGIHKNIDEINTKLQVLSEVNFRLLNLLISKSGSEVFQLLNSHQGETGNNLKLFLKNIRKLFKNSSQQNYEYCKEDVIDNELLEYPNKIFDRVKKEDYLEKNSIEYTADNISDIFLQEVVSKLNYNEGTHYGYIGSKLLLDKKDFKENINNFLDIFGFIPDEVFGQDNIILKNSFKQASNVSKFLREGTKRDNSKYKSKLHEQYF